MEITANKEMLDKMIDAFVQMHGALEQMPEMSGDLLEIALRYKAWRAKLALPAFVQAEALISAGMVKQ